MRWSLDLPTISDTIMTLGMAWVRRVSNTTEFVVAVDSRLSGGQAWDGCPKLILLPRSDCKLAFSGDTRDAYPLVLQIINAINMHPRTRDRAIDIAHLKGHMTRVWKDMRTFIHSLPRGQAIPDAPDVSFVFGGFSWRDQAFRVWKLTGSQDGFSVDRPDQWGKGLDEWTIQFFGDKEAIKDAKKRLAKNLRSKGKLPKGDFDMEPFEVLRDIIREAKFFSVGGPPQVAKVYQHMNALPFAVSWPDKHGRATVFGRPLLEYEISRWPIIDPDAVAFQPRDPNRLDDFDDDTENV